MVLGAPAAAALGATPNDPLFGLQWGDSNTGQSIPLQEPPGEVLKGALAGSPGADDRASEAWGVTTGSRAIAIGEVDTGVDYDHPDLKPNIWNNPDGKGECPVGTHGYNVLGLLPEEKCNPLDTENEPEGYGGHGTHVAGIMGAVGNNGFGVAGMNWQTTIVPVRWQRSAKVGGEASDLIAGLKWLVKLKTEGVNVRVVNDSPNFESDQPGLKPAIEELGANNILFVTAAGNSVKPYFPCVYDLPNEICVTATNNRDELPGWANRDPTTVDLAAPGASIFSTTLSEGSEGKYGYLSGGSMAAPQVSGAAALILSVNEGLSAAELKADILNNVDRLPSLVGQVRTGGRLDVCKALPGCPPPPPPPPVSPPPPPPPPPPQPSLVAITSRFLTIKHGMTKVGLRCSGPTACASKLALTVRIKKRSGHGTRTTFKTKVLTIGTATFSAPAGGTVRVTIKLNAIGRKIVGTGSGRLYVNLTIFASAPAPPTTKTQRILLVWKPAHWRGR
jgi:thermitase